ncbi:MAG: tetratricopeptide repeat protein [Phycisphaerales bacterium]|nr:tetratricopeptide repeat protein [Phycisphaerae bacterium]NNF44804.1 tetratricopeptide repeat protein [Phycisphaerales bacterium]NNM27130.1 tetratricopeptide repeat protein [Phycisphaerales bacterium]
MNVLTPIALAAACTTTPLRDDVTFNRDIAPIVFAHCAVCHRPGESAPFSLLTYDDVRRRARQIGIVTRQRYMPPWLPDPAVSDFAGVRRLSDDELDRIATWIANGTPEGDPADLPPPPQWTEGWQLGEPDLIVTAPEAFTVPADGVDVFRNLVIPLPVSTTRFVRAVELRPGNPAVVHHAIMQVDRTGSVRRLDTAEPGPGFAGMGMGRSEPPDGHFLGWTPGKLPRPGRDDIAWRLDPGTDLVLQLHMLPTGKPETIRPSIGFFFADRPPARRPFVITLRNDLIDIPAGAEAHVVRDRFTLPVDVEVLGVYPHAHYLGRELKAFATMPGGERAWIIHIPAWNFDWQDEYQFARPLRLPAGATIEIEYTYDNSAGNVRNPSHPPRRVRFGNQSSDEMATLALQVLTETEADRATLAAADERKTSTGLIAYARRHLEDAPDSAIAYELIGTAERTLGRPEQAIAAFQRAVELRPDFVDALINLGNVLGESNRHSEAIAVLRRALTHEPDAPDIHANLGVALGAVGRPEEAMASLRHALQLEPNHVGALYNLGSTLAATGRSAEAVAVLERVIALQPDHIDALNNLGVSLAASGREEAALQAYRRAIEFAPDRVVGHFNLGNGLLAAGNPGDAVRSFRDAVRVDPGHARAHASLGLALRQTGKLASAIDAMMRAAELAPTDAVIHHELGRTLLASRRASEARETLERAVERQPNNVAMRNDLAIAAMLTGDLDAAGRTLEAALALDPDATDTHGNLGLVRAQQDRPGDSITHYRRALEREPDRLACLRGLAWILATSSETRWRDPAEALALAQRAAELTRFGNPAIMDTLAAALAANGDFDRAVQAAEHAATIATRAGNRPLAEIIETRLTSYRKGRPHREP